MATSQLVEELLIECVTLLTTARRHEDVASNKLMNNFAVSSDAAKSNVDVAFKLNGHLSGVRNTKRNLIEINKSFISYFGSFTVNFIVPTVGCAAKFKLGLVAFKSNSPLDLVFTQIT